MALGAAGQNAAALDFARLGAIWLGFRLFLGAQTTLGWALQGILLGLWVCVFAAGFLAVGQNGNESWAGICAAIFARKPMFGVGQRVRFVVFVVILLGAASANLRFCGD